MITFCVILVVDCEEKYIFLNGARIIKNIYVLCILSWYYIGTINIMKAPDGHKIRSISVSVGCKVRRSLPLSPC